MIINLNHYITVEEAAARAKLTVKTILGRIGKSDVRSIKIDGTYFVLDAEKWSQFMADHPGFIFGLDRKQTVHAFAKKNPISPCLLYENIIGGRINAWAVGTKVLIDPEEPALHALMAERKQKYKRKPRR